MRPSKVEPSGVMSTSTRRRSTVSRVRLMSPSPLEGVEQAGDRRRGDDQLFADL